LAAAGAWVAMVARSAEALRAAAERCGGHPFPTDVSSAAEVAALASEVTRGLGAAPDAIVNAAGAFDLLSFVETPAEVLDEHLAANVRGPFLVIRAFLPQMIARRSGHIVNVGSIAGRLALPGNAAYSASKFGMRGMHEVLALELAGTGVKTTIIEPAATDTPLWDQLDPDTREDLPPRSAMLRANDVARAIVYAIAQPPQVEVSSLAIRSIG
jgi:NADP-dependent 3-hydroxy acid dehydrogenase YdfG